MNTYDAPARRRELRSGYRELNQLLPDQMRGFGDLHRSAMADGALSSAQKEMIELAIGITEGCTDCVTLHTHDALRAGATREEVGEAIGVAVMMGGGPATTVATTAVSTLEQFEAAAKS
jgi:AhpD family alkylhydroperoxidase